MRKARALLISAVVAAGLVLSLSAPAHAEARLRGVYYDYSECVRVGQYGQQQGWWGYWWCQFQSNYYFLYA
jgi:hypothetical protein